MNKQASEIALDFIPRIKTKLKKPAIEIKTAEEVGSKFNDYFTKYIDLKSEGVVIVNSKKRSDFDTFLNIDYNSIINFHKINDVRYINKFFEKINSLLPRNGVYIGTFESSNQRKERILSKYPKIYGYPFYFGTFILKRIFPKWAFTKKIYFFLTQGKNRYLSLAEVLGRLVSCGFEIIDYAEPNNQTFFVVKKVKEPSFDENVSYGPLFGMRRIGKNGKVIKVYKIRTMHPYAEYLQSFIHKKNNLSGNGKFKNDFRITTWGKIFRKFWIDELPMLLNLIKGDLKLVGVRPLSQHYLSLYPDSLRNLRLKTKPGLVPPFYADMPKTFTEIVKSEETYLTEYFQNPIKTDIKYFYYCFKNIFFRQARSS